MSVRSRPSIGEVVRVAVAALFFTAAPTAGDIGSCGQEPDDLDAPKFFAAKQSIDCAKCDECSLATAACSRACDPPLDQSTFAEGCYPLVHDGEVCLNALWAAACDDYARYAADEGATVPSECDFCPVGER